MLVPGKLTALEQIVSQNRLETTDLVIVFILFNTASYIFSETDFKVSPWDCWYAVTVFAWSDINISEFYVIFHYRSITSTSQNVCIGIKMD
jgi:hypothetical protein